MAALAQLDPTTHEDVAASKITQVFETKLFYLIRGRNAWHSTWVTHYYERCMHDDMRSAKDRAEELRERGSVFTIREQPALAFRSNKGIALITEINTPAPLASWIKKYKNEKSDCRLNQDHCRLERLFSSTRTLGALVGALSDRNIFPDYLPAWSKNIFVLWTRDNTSLNEDRRNRLKRWQSSSGGAAYYLGWDQEAADVSGRAVRRVADALTHRIEVSARR